MPLTTELFADSGVQITVEGRRHLGAALGTESFTESYVKGKVQEWVEEVTRLTKIATSQPHEPMQLLPMASAVNGRISIENCAGRKQPPLSC